MAQIKRYKSGEFTVMSNYHFRDARLSGKAMGILSLILSLPDDWDLTIAGLTKMFSDGRCSVKTGIQELEKAGYVKRTPVTNEKGQFIDLRYDVFERPQTVTEE